MLATRVGTCMGSEWGRDVQTQSSPTAAPRDSLPLQRDEHPAPFLYRYYGHKKEHSYFLTFRLLFFYLNYEVILALLGFVCLCQYYFFSPAVAHS